MPAFRDFLFCHFGLDNKFLNNKREDVVEEAEEKGGEERNEDHNDGEADGLLLGWPRYMGQFGSRILDVINESIHVWY
jgi:hypothetical protein